MSEFDIHDYIDEKNGNQPSADDQHRVVNWFISQQYWGESDRYATTSEVTKEVGDDLDHTTGTVLGNLTEIDILRVFSGNGPQNFILKARTGEFLMGDDVDLGAEVDEEIRRFLNDVNSREAGSAGAAATDGGVTIREVAADELGVAPHLLESEVRGGEVTDRMDSLDNAVGAIIAHPDVEKADEYDQIGFRRSANRYQLTSKAVPLIPMGDRP